MIKYIASKKDFLKIYDTGRRHLFDYVDDNQITTCEVFRIAKTNMFEMREYRGWKMAIKIHSVDFDGGCGAAIAQFRTFAEAMIYLKGHKNLTIPKCSA